MKYPPIDDATVAAEFAAGATSQALADKYGKTASQMRTLRRQLRQGDYDAGMGNPGRPNEHKRKQAETTAEKNVEK